MSRLCIPLTNEQQKQIKIKAAESGLSMAEIARRFLLAWLEGDVLTNEEINGIYELVYQHKHGDKWTRTLGKLERMKEWATR